MGLAEAGTMLLSLCILFVLFLSFQMYKKKWQLPPGPTPWPFLGNLFQKNVIPLAESYRKLSGKYGPIFTIWIGTKPMVVLCGYDIVKDALLDHAEEFGGRPPVPINERIFHEQGKADKNDKKWRELRRFMLSTLRDFGMGKKTMSERVQEEARCLVEEMATTQGKPFDPRRYISSAVSNVICSVVFGNRFDYKDLTFRKNQQIVESQLAYFNSFLGLVYSSFPRIMDYVPGPHNNVFSMVEKLCDFIRENVEFHKKTLEPQSPRDYIDCFLIKLKKEENSTEAMYTTEELVKSVFSLFLAGTTTTTRALLYSLLVMAKLPQVQAKVQQEIDEVVGVNHTPGMEDRLKMPFTNAVVHEIQRYQLGSLENFPRATTCDVKFRGFNIPKFTAVCPMLSSVHFDHHQWKNPETFDPDNFLDEKGQFKKRDAFMPFSAGKRSCPGESLARMELFLFFSALLQKFTFRLAEDTKNIDIMSLFKLLRNENQFPLIQAIKRSAGSYTQ